MKGACPNGPVKVTRTEWSPLLWGGTVNRLSLKVVMLAYGLNLELEEFQGLVQCDTKYSEALFETSRKKGCAMHRSFLSATESFISIRRV